MLARPTTRALLLVAVAFLDFNDAVQAADLSAPSDSTPLNLRAPGIGEDESAPSSPTLVAPETPALPRRLSFGINDLGTQLRWHLTPRWATEMRFLTGSADSDVGTVRANVFGLRGYRFFSERHRFRFYAGLEAAYVHTSIRSFNNGNNPNSITNIAGFGETSGYAAGGFGGVEFRLGRRIAIDADLGPYMIGLQEKVTRASDASLDFVLNSAINVYLF